jgi:hypothetical protein
MEEEIVENSDKEGVMIKGRLGARQQLWSLTDLRSTIEIGVQIFVKSES